MKEFYRIEPKKTKGWKICQACLLHLSLNHCCAGHLGRTIRGLSWELGVGAIHPTLLLRGWSECWGTDTVAHHSAEAEGTSVTLWNKAFHKFLQLLAESVVVLEARVGAAQPGQQHPHSNVVVTSAGAGPVCLTLFLCSSPVLHRKGSGFHLHFVGPEVSWLLAGFCQWEAQADHKRAGKGRSQLSPHCAPNSVQKWERLL